MNNRYMKVVFQRVGVRVLASGKVVFQRVGRSCFSEWFVTVKSSFKSPLHLADLIYRKRLGISWRQFMAQPIEQKLATYYTGTYRKSGAFLGYRIFHKALIIKYLCFSSKTNDHSHLKE